MLDWQANALDEERGRVSAVLGAASIVAAFLGGKAVENGDLTIWSVLAVAAFVVIGGCTAYVLVPREGWRFVTAPKQLIETRILSADSVDLSQLQWDLALKMEERYDSNEPRRRRLLWALEIACVALVVEATAWIIDLIVRT